jgi:hypothetical protein
MPATTFYLPFRPALDANGIVVPGALLYFYATGTTTPQTIYADNGLVTPLANPVQANAAGRWPSIYLNDALTYRVVLKDADGATLDDQDPYIPGSLGERGLTGPAGTASSNSGVATTGWTTDVASTGATSAWHVLSPPTGPFTNSAGGDDRVRASLIANVGKFTQGPTGHANYYDTVIAFGLNMNQSYSPLNTAMASASYRIESKFAQGGASDPFAVEFHTSMGSTDASSVEFRAVSCFVPHLKANWAVSAGVTLRGGQISFTDGTITPQIAGTERVKFDFRPGQNTINLGKNGSERAPGFSTDSNGVYVFRQINAANNAFISLPFINTDDMTEVSAAFKVVADAKADSTFSITAFNVGQCTALAPSAYLDFVVSQSATAGAVYGIVRNVNASGTMTNKMENTGAGAAVLNVKGSTATAYQVNDTQVVGVRKTGWAADTGTAKRTANATYSGTAEGSYTQATIQALMDKVRDLSQTVKALKDDLTTHGLIGS